MIEWFVTSPGSRAFTSHAADCGQRGWRLHAVVIESTKTTMGEIRCAISACGIRPRHGWALDLFIEKRCERCEGVLSKRGGKHPYPFRRITDKAGKRL